PCPPLFPYTPLFRSTTMVPLTLEQAMDIALEKNLALKAARLAPQMADYQLASARAAFLPQLTGTYTYNDATQLTNDIIDQGVSRSEEHTSELQSREN